MKARAVFWVSFALINVYMAWSSRLLREISPSLFSLVNVPLQWQDAAIWKGLDLSRVSAYSYAVADLEAMVLLAVVMVSAAWLARGRGRVFSLLRGAQVGAFCLVVFGAELALLDYPEFYEHVMDLQASLGIVPWFNNADMLCSSFAVFVTTTLLLNRPRPAIVFAGESTPRVVDRRNVGRFLVLFPSGALLLVGGLLVAWYGGTWMLSYSSLSSAGGSYAPYHMLTSYPGCVSQLEVASALALTAACRVGSLDSGGLVFVGLGAVSLLAGSLSLRKRPALSAERVSGFWWLLALVVPLAGGLIGFFEVRGRNRASGISMILLGVEVFLGLMLLVHGGGLIEGALAPGLPTGPGSAAFLFAAF